MYWEYKTINLYIFFNTGSGVAEKVQEACDEQGKFGWELVNFQCYDLSTKCLLVFKRQYCEK